MRFDNLPQNQHAAGGTFGHSNSVLVLAAAATVLSTYELAAAGTEMPLFWLQWLCVLGWEIGCIRGEVLGVWEARGVNLCYVSSAR